jgi:hypothetical protein
MVIKESIARPFIIKLLAKICDTGNEHKCTRSEEQERRPAMKTENRTRHTAEKTARPDREKNLQWQLHKKRDPSYALGNHTCCARHVCRERAPMSNASSDTVAASAVPLAGAGAAPPRTGKCRGNADAGLMPRRGAHRGGPAAAQDAADWARPCGAAKAHAPVRSLPPRGPSPHLHERANQNPMHLYGVCLHVRRQAKTPCTCAMPARPGLTGARANGPVESPRTRVMPPMGAKSSQAWRRP